MKFIYFVLLILSIAFFCVHRKNLLDVEKKTFAYYSDSLLVIEKNGIDYIKYPIRTIFKSSKPKIITYIFSDCGSCLSNIIEVDSVLVLSKESKYEHFFVINSYDLLSFSLFLEKFPNRLKHTFIYDQDESIKGKLVKSGVGNQCLILDKDLNIICQVEEIKKAHECVQLLLNE